MTRKQKILSFCTVVIVCISLLIVSWLLKVKDSDIKYASFYDNAEELDVLFYGSSIVHYGIYPMQLWNEYGITSYNMGNNSERLYMTYYTILNSLDYASPKIVVVDMGGLGWAGQKTDGTLKDHGFLDSVPLSVNKIKAVYDLFEESRRLEFIFPSVVYHSRWAELSVKDVCVPRSYTYGADILTNIDKLEKPTKDRYEESRNDSLELEADTLLRIQALCEERDIKLICIFMPYEVRGGDQKLREFAEEFTSKNNILYYDLQNVETIDWENDFADASHMNYKGAKNITGYLGKLLQDDCDVVNHNGESDYVDWNDAHRKYEEYCAQLLK